MGVSFHSPSNDMSFFSVIGRIMVLLIALVSPVYRVRVQVTDDETTYYMYHFLYEFESDSSGNKVSFNTDVGYLIVLGITFVCNLLTILVLTCVAFQPCSYCGNPRYGFGHLRFFGIPLYSSCHELRRLRELHCGGRGGSLQFHLGRQW